MDKEKVGLDKDLEKFLEKIKKKFKIEKVLLFGSRARGEALNYSDYDLIIISAEFYGISWQKRIEQLVIEWDSDKAIDVLPYTPSEFADKVESRTIVSDIINKGQAIEIA